MDQSPEFLKLLEENRGILLKVARVYCADAIDQEDLIQETIFQIWKSFDSYRSESKFSTWMYRVALNTAMTFIKRNRKRPLTNIENSLAETMPVTVDDSRERNSQLDQFYIAVDSLSKVEKALILLFLDGFSHREIGSQLGISEGNARVKLNRTKNKIRDHLKGMENDL